MSGVAGVAGVAGDADLRDELVVAVEESDPSLLVCDAGCGVDDNGQQYSNFVVERDGVRYEVRVSALLGVEDEFGSEEFDE